MGLAASNVSFVDHIPLQRGMISSKLSKQAYGRKRRKIEEQEFLDTPNTPLVVSLVGKALGLKNMYSGKRAISAVMPIGLGITSDDGYVMRKKSAESGMFNSTHIFSVNIHIGN